MQATGTAPQNSQIPRRTNWIRNFSWFLAAPVIAFVLISIFAALAIISYQYQHQERIFTGISVWGTDLGRLSREEAEQVMVESFPYSSGDAITLIESDNGQEWIYSMSELGLTFDAKGTVDAVYNIGRRGGPFERLREQFSSWYYGQQISPIVIFDEGQIDQVISDIALQIDQPATDASLIFEGSDVGFAPSQMGRSLDTSDTRARLMATLGGLHEAQIQLLVHETLPRVDDTSEAANEIRQIMYGPMTLYLQQPLAGVDLEKVVVTQDELARWVRVNTVENEQGEASTQVFLDENAIRAFLAPYETLLQREPENARYYFDDSTQELVLVEPHVNGRTLDVEATLTEFLEQVRTPNRSMPFALKEIVPVVHSGATAQELGITELVSESTTWFFGSANERMHNIARSAGNFYGVVIAPGEEFSFNQFLGEVSAEQGYAKGLIIYGGRTIEGIGGGVCQVSTTAFQAAFWAGYPITERWEHGYRVGYYDDGEGPGMDATVYSPLVDFRFLNDTPHYLLIENYYSEANSSLTFKFYSTSLGRSVVKEGPVIENVVQANPDVWELNEELETGEVEQVDWAVEGADVTVARTVLNASGELLRQDAFVSNYIPWQNIYQYGPGVEIPAVESVPSEGA